MIGPMLDMKEVLGKGAVVVSAVHTSFSHRHARARLVVDGRKVRRLMYMLVIANTGLFGADFLKITPEARVDDGVFHAALFKSHNFLRAWWDFLAIALRRLRELTDVDFFTCRKVEVITGRPVPYQIDGDFAGYTPLTVELLPRAMRVMAPAGLVGSGGHG
jgi:diacylglycerol kinase family enzyme